VSGFKDMVIGGIMIMLIVFCLFMVSITFSTSNNTTDPISSNPRLAKAFNSTMYYINQTEKTAVNNSQALTEESSNPTVTLLGFVFTSILSTGKLFKDVAVNIFNMIFTLLVEEWGINKYILSTISAVIVLTLVLGAWRMYRAGE